MIGDDRRIKRNRDINKMALKHWVAIALGAVLVVMTPARAGDAPSQSLMAYLRSGADTEAVALIRTKGASVINHRGHDGETPLTVAIRLRKLPHLALMLESGGDANFATREGDTPLMVAVRTGWTSGMAMLLDSKADPNLANRRGETPLIVTVQLRNIAAARALLLRGADPDKADRVAGLSARDYARRDTRVRDLARLIDAERPPRK